MRHLSLRARLIYNFSVVILIGVILFVLSGIRMIGDTIVKQAQDKVRLDLNSAREVYQNEISNIKKTVRLTALRFFLKDALLEGDIEQLTAELKKIRLGESLDILNLADNKGWLITGTRSPGISNKSLNREVVGRVIAEGRMTASTGIISGQDLLTEAEELAEQARIQLVQTSRSQPRDTVVETSGMVIEAAAPVYDYSDNIIAVLYGAKLINRNYEIVDRVKEIVYKNKKYKGKDIGTATIFQNDLRISTNVENSDGSRAIGTRVSVEVYNQVVVKGIPWTKRAFVVNDWYITAYEPIKNLAGSIIGMLYVGILEAPYRELRNKVLLNFLAIALISVILLVFIAYFTATRTTKPLKQLITATKEVARGNLSHRVQISSRDEIGQLADSFNRMTGDLENLTGKYQLLNRTLEDKVKEKTRALRETRDQLVQSEKLSSLGRMAAGVAHEINNPLTSILINSHLLAEEIENEDQLKENLNLIIEETTRCSTIVKDLLHFSRQTESIKKITDINEVIEKVISLLKNQFLLQKIKINKNLGRDLPEIVIDKNKIEQVFTNVMLNALDALPEGGELAVVSRVAADRRRLEILFRDSGCGIAEKDMGKIFDPFFTTKGTKGTGLGLSVSYGIIQQHGGNIDIHSEAGQGTTVTISFQINMSKENIK